MTRTTETQLASYLSDAHSIEEQALAQLRAAPGIAGDDRLAAALAEHLGETEMHERVVRERLDALGESPSRMKDLIMAVGGKGFLAFARSQPDTPGKLAAHAYSYEHLEIAAYELLARVARLADDPETEAMANRILPDERRMAERLESIFDATVRSSLAAVGSTDANEQVPAYLSDAHALEQQSVGLLRRAIDVSTAAQLQDAYRAHLAESDRHAALLEDRLAELGGSHSTVKDAAMRVGRPELGDLLRGASRYNRQGRGIRLCVRTPRDRGLRAAAAGGRDGGRRRDRAHGRRDLRARSARPRRPSPRSGTSPPGRRSQRRARRSASAR